ncbi:MAG: glycine zipper 2TM domain-containing protein [Methylophilus methylotrophus]|uniref:Glycine zipper 2TM domain-containing protein n=1 Tax=Methylophilus methylotrophus TaxID=17 RepID=A0A5C7WGX6_METME|nr:MAG: glycine zipper 2TM domain-containing protein [Methylophilus methylotrophus]
MKFTSQKSLKKSLLWVLLLAFTMNITACGSMSTRGKNTAIGAGIGAVGGAILTGGSALGTVGGAAVGGVVGNQINKK